MTESDFLGGPRALAVPGITPARGYTELIKFGIVSLATPFVFTVPGDFWFRIIIARLAVHTSAVAGERYAGIGVDDQDGYEVGRWVSSRQIPANTNSIDEWSPYAGGLENVPGKDTAVTASFAAGAAGSAAMPDDSYNLTGFDVNLAAGVTAASVSTITVTNVPGGPLSYTVQQELGSGATVSIRYPGNGLPASGGIPTVAINATVNGGSGTINAYGRTQETNFGNTHPIPDLLIRPGWRIVPFLQNPDAADSLLSGSLYVEKIPSGTHEWWRYLDHDMPLGGAKPKG